MKLLSCVFAIMMAPYCFAQNQTITVPAKTPVLLSFTNLVSSKTGVNGTPLQFTLAEDLILNSQIIIPRGTLATGEIIHAQKSSFGGKPGELILAARYLEFKGKQIKLRSLKPIAGPYVGKNYKNTSYGVAMLSPIAGVFITGSEITIPEGTLALAMIADETLIELISLPQDFVLPVTNLELPQTETIND